MTACAPVGIAPGSKTDAQVYLRELYPTTCQLAGVEVPEAVTASSFAPVLFDQAKTHHDAIFGFFNRRYLMLDATVGMMLIGLTSSLFLLVLHWLFPTLGLFVNSLREVISGGLGVRGSVAGTGVATRGDDLSLVHIQWTDGDSPTLPPLLEIYFVTEWSSEGLLQRAASFDQTQIDEAIECLEDWTEELHPEIRLVSSVTRALRRATIAFDRDALAETLAEDLICIDHQLASFPELDKLGMIERVAALWEQLPDGLEMISPASPAFNELGMIVTVNVSAIGGLGSWSYAMMMIVDREVISRIEIFPTDQVDRALARFDELTAVVPQSPAKPPAAVRVARDARRVPPPRPPEHHRPR